MTIREPRNIDMHCHLLPGTDDGCKTIEESLSILGEMARMGTDRVYLTPHLYSPRVRSELKTIKARFAELLEVIPDGFPEILLGSEICLMPGVSDLDMLPLGATDFVLVELPEDRPVPFLFDILRAIQQKGYIVIVAHVERYPFFYSRRRDLRSILTKNRSLDEIIKLRDHGIFFQVNWQTLHDSRQMRRSFAKDLLHEGLIDFVGSDKHTLNDGRTLIDYCNPLYSQFRNAELL